MTPAPVDAYLTCLAAERRLSPHTLAAARRDLGKLVTHTGGRPLDTLSVDDIRHAIVRLRAAGLSPRSVARHLSSWRGFYAFACRRLGFGANPCVGLRPPRAARALPATLSPDACTQLLDRLPDNALEIRDRALFELIYSSGLRLAEVVGLNLGDIDFAAGEARVTGKGSKTRIVPVGSQACAALRAWLPLRQQQAQAGVHAL
ncbi:MAG: tyrosine-type recombinase/integrase, partial [Thiobacillus sp.]|nr:tyrosine-type recombinase/integrase [Thiobacillus sp.]